MNSTTLLRPSLFLHHNPKPPSSIICSSSRNQPFIPKLEPFSRTKLDRVTKDLPLIQKSEKDLLGAFRFLSYFVRVAIYVYFHYFIFVWQIIVRQLKVMNHIVAGRLILSLKIFKYVFSKIIVSKSRKLIVDIFLLFMCI